MTMATEDTCNVASHLSSLYLYVNIHKLSLLICDKSISDVTSCQDAVTSKSLFVFLTGINVSLFRNHDSVSHRPDVKSCRTASACPCYERMNTCQHSDVLPVLLPGHAWVKKYQINSVPFLCYCSCLRVAYIAGVGKYGPRDTRGPRNIRVLPWW